jgi:hypothetical protein
MYGCVGAIARLMPSADTKVLTTKRTTHTEPSVVR